MTTIKLRRGTGPQWAAANPVLAQGELGYDTTAGLLRMGDGVTAWLGLPSFLTMEDLATPDFEVDFTTKPDGAPPAVADTGQALRYFGSTPYVVSGGALTYDALPSGSGNSAAYCQTDAEDGGKPGDEYAAVFMEASFDAASTGEQTALVLGPTVWDHPVPKGAASVHATYLGNRVDVGNWTSATVTPKYIDAPPSASLDVRGTGYRIMGVVVDKARDTVTELFPCGRLATGGGTGHIAADSHRYMIFEGFNNDLGTVKPPRIRRVWAYKRRGAAPGAPATPVTLEAVQRAIDNRAPSADPMRPTAKVLALSTSVSVPAPNGSWGDLHAGMTVTFTAPASGAVLIRLDARLDYNSGSLNLQAVNTATGASLRAVLVRPQASPSCWGMSSFAIPVNGLTAGQTYTVKLQQFQNTTYAAGSAGSQFLLRSVEAAVLSATPLDSAVYVTA